MRVAIIGCGYVGLVSGVCLAARGHHVACVDLDAALVAGIDHGVPHIHERGLPALLAEVRAAARFTATTDLAAALDASDIVLLAVGTPTGNGAIDLGFITAAARAIGRHIRGRDRFLPVIVKSTVVPGTTDGALRQAIEAASGKPASGRLAGATGGFGLGMNPEFLREGEAVGDFMNPDRIVLGHDDPATLAALEELYAPWNCDKLRVNSRTAELIKYASNALLAVQISAVNELANLAAALGGIDIMEVVAGVHLDRRWNPIRDGARVAPAILSYLVPGCGFGGSCFPKDVQALAAQGAGHGVPMALLQSVLAVNEAQPGQVTALLERELGSLAGRTGLVLGLAFKPETDDVRESASLKIVEQLLARGARVLVHDPVAAGSFARALGPRAGEVEILADWRAGLAPADFIVVATRWSDYAALPGAAVAGKVIFDARRMFDPAAFPGATYLAIGRRVEKAQSAAK